MEEENENGLLETANKKEKKHAEKDVPPDGGYGWVIVACCIIINSCLLPLTQCFGIIYKSDFENMGITAAETSTLLHLHNAIWCSLGIFSGPLLKKYNFQQVAFMGGFLVCIGVFLTAFMKSYVGLIFSVCFIIGIGHGIALPATYMAVYTYFKKRVTLAVSFQVTGAAIAPAIMPQLCAYLLDNFSTSGTVLILAGVALNSIPAILLLRPLKIHTEKKEFCENIRKENNCCNDFSDKMHVSEQLMGAPYKETTVPIKTESAFKQVRDIFNLELFTSRVYLVIVIGMGISYVSELNIVLMIPFVLSKLAQFDTSNVAKAMSTQAIADIIGRLALPILAHKSNWSSKVIYSTALIGSSVGRTIFAVFYNCDIAVFLSCFLLGLFKGLKAVFQSIIIPKYICFDKLASANGLMMVVNGLLSIAIGPIIGLTHDLTDSYVFTLHTASILSISCIVIWIVDALNKSDSTSEVAQNNEQTVP